MDVLKRLMSLIISLGLVMSMCVTVYGEDDPIDNSEDYQINEELTLDEQSDDTAGQLLEEGTTSDKTVSVKLNEDLNPADYTLEDWILIHLQNKAPIVDVEYYHTNDTTCEKIIDSFLVSHYLVYKSVTSRGYSSADGICESLDFEYQDVDPELDPTGKTLDEWIALNLSKRIEIIDTEYYEATQNLTIEKAEKAYINCQYNHLEYCYVNTGAYGISQGQIQAIYDPDVTDADVAAFKTKCDEIMAQIDNSWTDLQKILFIHDYIVTHTVYDYSLSKYSAFNNIVEGSSVCEGYALAFKHFMNLLNIPCEYIVSEESNHAWNAVKVNGYYYYIDVTSDDPEMDDKDEATYCRHKYCLLTKDEFYGTNLHEYDDWKTPDGTDAFNKIITGLSFETGSTSFLHYVLRAFVQGDYCMYYPAVVGDTALDIYRYDFLTKQRENLYTIYNTAAATYTGKTVTPDVNIVLADGTKLTSSQYTATCDKTIKNIGTYQIKVAVNQYSDMKYPVTLKVNPAGTKIKKLTKKSKGFKATWTKKTDQVDGYQLEYSLSSSFSGSKKVSITKNKTTSKTVSKLKKKKYYYVRIRTYKKVSGTTYYSVWSAKKKVKTK